MFIGRTKELNNLNERYLYNNFDVAIIYGRRRVGKTTLINEFIKDKQAIFYTGIESNAKENLEGLSKSIYAISDNFTNANSSFASFQDALETVFEIAKKNKIIFVIDEYPYLANSYKSISSILQVLIDKNKDTANMFLILCGSSMSFMENQVLGYESPLFGRRTCQFKISPFEFGEMKHYYKKFNNEQLAIIYGITGGIPLYMSMMNDGITIEKNIKANFLEPNAYLFEEPTNLIKQECRDPAHYNAIIKAIATGASKMSEISSKTGIDTALAASYLNKLISLGIVKKERPIGGKSNRKTIYVIEDSMFKFWYQFIPDNIAAINRGLADIVYQKISTQLTTFMGIVFEEICKQYLWELNRQEKLSIPFINLGRWWGNDPINKCEIEIDIVGIEDTESALFCECKWTNQKIDVSILNKLIERSNLFHYSNTHFFLFAKVGFTNSCQEKAKELKNVTLVKFDDIVNIF